MADSVLLITINEEMHVGAAMCWKASRARSHNLDGIWGNEHT